MKDLPAGRELISDQRYIGLICEWRGTWGLIEPLDAVNHPRARAGRSRIYASKSDIRDDVELEESTYVEFNIYCDAKGLGAINITNVTEEGDGAEASAKSRHDEEVLPEGWTKHWSAEHEEYYYWNKGTKETSWETPSAAANASDEEDNEDDQPDRSRKRQLSSSRDDPSKAQRKGDGKRNARRIEVDSDGKIRPLHDENAPPRKGGGKWKASRNQAQSDGKIRPVDPNSFHSRRADEKKAERERLQEKAREETEALVRKQETKAREEVLPAGWAKHWSAEHEEYYYWNKSTKQTSWERPRAAVDDSADGDESGVSPWLAKWTQIGAPKKDGLADEDLEEFEKWNKLEAALAASSEPR
mmetsp:Transcript_91174/g.142295  ORF Transcript_91174/g.142295 Transcript_91174/m.142295 type:complete len:358 (+) Transcript_91174:3-1076(+)